VESGEWRLTIEDWRLIIGDHLWRVTIRHHKALSAISKDEIESAIETANGYRRVQFELCSRITHHITHHSPLLSIIIRIIIIIIDRVWLAVIVLLILKFKPKQLSEYEINVLPQRIHFVSACWFKLKGAKSIEGKSDCCCTIVICS
jgi:hypothetical protein